MYSINRMNTFSCTNTVWAMWHQQQQQQVPNYQGFQGLNVNSFINNHKNAWSVHFSNTYHDFSVFQIQQIFGFYGKVNGVIQLKQLDRTVYVNYEAEMDAKRCVVGMMQQNFIKLRPFIMSHNSNPMANRQSMYNHNLGNVFSTKSDVINHVNSGNLSPTSGGSSEDTSDKPPTHYNPFQQSPRQTTENPFNQFKENQQTGCSEVMPKLNGDSTNIVKNSAKLQGNGTIAEEGKSVTAEKTEMSEKSIATPRRSTEDKPQAIIEAQEVIVGNIPEAFGVFYVLHLLEKFKPICASEMKTLWKHSLRYCHIYFETPGDAEAAETNFDDVELTGRNLIVMRPHTLAEEAEQYEMKK